MSTPTEDDLIVLGETLSHAVASLAEARNVLSNYQQTKLQYQSLVQSQQEIVKTARQEVKRLSRLVADAANAQPAE